MAERVQSEMRTRAHMKPRVRRVQSANGVEIKQRKGGVSQETEARGSNAAHFADWNGLIAVKIIKIAEVISRSATQVYEAGYGIRNSELRILLLLGSGEALSATELSRRASIDKAWISRSLDVMMRAGLVKREPDSADSRKSLVSLTPAGHRNLKIITPIALTRDRFILAGLDEKNVHLVLDALLAKSRQLLLPEIGKRQAPEKRRSRSRRAKP